MSFFESINLLPEDPILNLPIIFAADTKKQKINLGVGVYRNEEGKPQVLQGVRLAEEKIFNSHLNLEYPPIQGNHEFIKEILALIFGKDHPLENIFGTQTIGGTGALRIAADFLVANHNSRKIFISEPTWPNHRSIFTKSGLDVHTYPYYDPINKCIDFSAMKNSIDQMPLRSIILLQACCHNPTGIDPSFDQWKEIFELVKKRQLIPLFDLAYQGFGQSLDEDAQAIRLFLQEGYEMFVAYSCSKNFGLYGERVGLLAVVNANGDISKKVGSHIKQIIRCSYSMPPLQGQRIATTILQSNELRNLWQNELTAMKKRIEDMRHLLAGKLLSRLPKEDFSFIANQKGMFSLISLNPEQVKRMISEFSVYTPSNGRINFAGLNHQNMDYFIETLSSIVKP